MTNSNGWETRLDEVVDRSVRRRIETRYWEPIADHSRLVSLLEDPALGDDPGRHLGLFADHSVVHARDVAARTLTLLDTHHGRSIEARDAERFAFVRGCAVLLALLHDVGMVEATPAGRAMHAHYAAQLPFQPSFADLLDDLMDDGTVAARLTATSERLPETDARRLLQEVLAMCLGHSKSAVDTELLDDRDRLRAAMALAVAADLDTLYAARCAGGWTTASAGDGADEAAFAWLTSADPEIEAFALDVIDAVRILRVADALRQRGADLRTSAGFEVFVDDTGHAVFAIHDHAVGWAAHLRVESPLSSGEANLARCWLRPDGALEIGFERVDFSGAAADRVADACAAVIADVAHDVLGVLPLGDRALIEIAIADEGRDFAERVESALTDRAPAFADRIRRRVTMDETHANVPGSPIEHDRFGRGLPVDPDDPALDELFEGLRRQGTRIAQLDRIRCAADARMVELEPDTVFIREGEPSEFVYFVLDHGVELHSGGGFGHHPLAPFLALGSTGVVRRGRRNSTVSTNRSCRAVMVPARAYREQWFRPYGPDDLDELRTALRS